MQPAGLRAHRASKPAEVAEVPVVKSTPEPAAFSPIPLPEPAKQAGPPSKPEQVAFLPIPLPEPVTPAAPKAVAQPEKSPVAKLPFQPADKAMDKPLRTNTKKNTVRRKTAKAGGTH